jgi:hypothetical protein
MITTCTSRLFSYTSRLGRCLIHDETGAYLTTELIILMTVLVFGLAAGLNAIAGSVNGELGDIAQAIQLDQSFSYNGLNAPGHATCSGSGYVDIDIPPVVTATPPFIPPPPPQFAPLPTPPAIPIDQIEDIPLPQAVVPLDNQVPVFIDEILGVNP